MYCIVNDSNIITNIILCEDVTAHILGALPAYDGAVIGNEYVPTASDESKMDRILQSKSDLNTYLMEHPLLWTDGNYYSITEEKQNQLTRVFAVYEIDLALGKEAKLEWNDTGERCREWSKEELSMLASAINERVRPLVKYQQDKEIEMKNAVTQAELDAIEVNYDEVE